MTMTRNLQNFSTQKKICIGRSSICRRKGTKFDYDGQDKGVLVPRSVYQDIIDLYLDEDEAGDMTDPKMDMILKSSVLVQVKWILPILLVLVNN